MNIHSTADLGELRTHGTRQPGKTGLISSIPPSTLACFTPLSGKRLHLFGLQLFLRSDSSETSTTHTHLAEAHIRTYPPVDEKIAKLQFQIFKSRIEISSFPGVRHLLAQQPETNCCSIVQESESGQHSTTGKDSKRLYCSEEEGESCQLYNVLIHTYVRGG